jgi:hypothetical protein
MDSFAPNIGEHGGGAAPSVSMESIGTLNEVGTGFGGSMFDVMGGSEKTATTAAGGTTSTAPLSRQESAGSALMDDMMAARKAKQERLEKMRQRRVSGGQ